MPLSSSSPSIPDPVQASGRDGPWLVLDTSTPTVKVGALYNNQWIAFVSSDRPTHEALDHAVREVSDACSCPPHRMAGFAYCQGPGSILGIRLAIISIKAWRALRPIGEEPAPVYSFTSLEIAAETLAKSSGKSTDPVAIVAEWKKNAWNTLTFSPDSRTEYPAIEVWDPDRLASWAHRIYVIEQRKQWTPLPPEVPRITPDPDCLIDPALRVRLLSPADTWPIYSPEEKQYIVWSGERHRAPAPAS